MFNNKRITWAFALLATALASNLIWSCQKDAITPDVPAANVPVEIPILRNVKFEDGRLKFATALDFESAIDKMELVGQKGADQVEKQFSGFVSNYLAYKKMLRENGDNLNPAALPPYITATKGDDGETYLRSSVDFKYLRHLANSNGVYQIGNTVYRCNYDKWYSADQAFAGDLESGVNLDHNPNVEAHDIIRETEVIHDRTSFMSCSQMYHGSPYERKFHGEVNNTVGAYSEVRVDFDHYKRGLFGAWYHNDAPSMNFAGTVTVKCCTNVCTSGGTLPCSLTPMAASMAGSNESEIFDVLATCIGGCGGTVSAVAPSSVTYNGIGDWNFNFTCTATK